MQSPPRRRPVPGAGQRLDSSPLGPRTGRDPLADDGYMRTPMQYPYHTPYPYAQHSTDLEEGPATSSLPIGTLLHKGFYDLLAMIPTPSPSRLAWRTPIPAPDPEPLFAGPRYEELPPTQGTRASPKKGRRISKDMVSKPTGFVQVHTPSCLSFLINLQQSSCPCIRCRPARSSSYPLGS